MSGGKIGQKKDERTIKKEDIKRGDPRELYHNDEEKEAEWRKGEERAGDEIRWKLGEEYRGVKGREGKGREGTAKETNKWGTAYKQTNKQTNKRKKMAEMFHPFFLFPFHLCNFSYYLFLFFIFTSY